MHTVEELEGIRSGILQRGTLDHQELVYFTRSLHELFLSVGLRSKYSPSTKPSSYQVYAGAGSKEVRVMITTTGWYTQVVVSEYFRSLIYTFEDGLPTDIQGLVDGLQALCKEMAVREYCEPCYYSDQGGDYCGLGIGPALGCTHLTINQTHG